MDDIFLLTLDKLLKEADEFISKGMKQKESVLATKAAYLASTGVARVVEIVEPPEELKDDLEKPIEERVTQEAEKMRRGLQAEGRTRDIFEVLNLFDDGLLRTEIREKTGYTPKDIATVIDRGEDAGTIKEELGRSCLTALGRTLLRRSLPYSGKIDFKLVMNNRHQETATATSSGKESVAATVLSN